MNSDITKRTPEELELNTRAYNYANECADSYFEKKDKRIDYDSYRFIWNAYISGAENI